SWWGTGISAECWCPAGSACPPPLVSTSDSTRPGSRYSATSAASRRSSTSTCSPRWRRDMPDDRIRRVRPEDVEAVVQLAHDLAEHERAPQECTLAAAQLPPTRFADTPA